MANMKICFCVLLLKLWFSIGFPIYFSFIKIFSSKHCCFFCCQSTTIILLFNFSFFCLPFNYIFLIFVVLVLISLIAKTNVKEGYPVRKIPSAERWQDVVNGSTFILFTVLFQHRNDNDIEL